MEYTLIQLKHNEHALDRILLDSSGFIIKAVSDASPTWTDIWTRELSKCSVPIKNVKPGEFCPVICKAHPDMTHIKINVKSIQILIANDITIDATKNQEECQ